MDFLRIAQIARPHGVRGAVKLYPLTDNTDRFYGLQEAYLETDRGYLPVSLSQISVQPDAVMLKISNCDSREEAEKLRGVYLCVDRAHAVQLPEYTYFIVDLIGCEISDTAGNHYGKIVDVHQTGANDVYIIRDKNKETLVPALKKVLHCVDIPNKRIVLDHDVMKEVALFS